MSLPPYPWDHQERRLETDRRAKDRQGKFDRRRNRCIACQFFKTSEQSETGFCSQHNTAMAIDAFACPLFKKIES